MPDKAVARFKVIQLTRQIWLGTGVGFGVTLLLGCALVATFYVVGVDRWSEHEYRWEGAFGILSSLILTVMGHSMLRVSKLEAKWRGKILRQLEGKTDDQKQTLGDRLKVWSEAHALFVVPFVTLLREGVEAVVFVGGVTVGTPVQSVPLPAVLGLLAGVAVGGVIYKSGKMASLKFILTAGTCLLYHVGAGLFSRSVWFLEADEWNRLTGGDAAETGSGPGSYDPRRSVWHVDCCNPQLRGGGDWWGVFNGLLGWQNSATYGSVLAYNAYWYAVMLSLVWIRYRDRRRSAGKKASGR